MDAAKPDSIDPPDDAERWRDRAMLYLLGEMSPEQELEFVLALAESAWLADELADQSAVLSAAAQSIGAVEPVEPVEPVSAGRPVSAVEPVDAGRPTGAVRPIVSKPDGPTKPDRQRRRWAAAVLALAGCALAVVGVRSPGTPNANHRPTEDLLIARAWVDTLEASEAHLSDLPIDGGDEFVDADADLWLDQGPSDSTLAWMLTAVSSENQSSGVTDDLDKEHDNEI